MLSLNVSAQRYWVYNGTGSGNWSNTANWSTTSGGLGGASAPNNIQDVIFDSGGTGDCNVDQSVNIRSLTSTSAYAGIISQNTNAMVFGAGGFSFSGGTFQGGSGFILCQSSFSLLLNSIFNSTSGQLRIWGNITHAATATFNHNNGSAEIFALGGGLTINGSLAFNNLSLRASWNAMDFTGDHSSVNLSITSSSGSVTLNGTGANSLTVTNTLNTIGGIYAISINDLIIDAKGDINVGHITGGGSGTIAITGTSPQIMTGSTILGNGDLPNIRINCSDLTLVNTITTDGDNFDYISGTLNTIGSTVYFENATGDTFLNGNPTLNNVTIRGGYNDLFVSDGLTLLGNLVIDSNTGATDLQLVENLIVHGDVTFTGTNAIEIEQDTLQVHGDVYASNSAANGGSGTLEFVGSTDQNFNGSGTIENGNVRHVVIDKPAGVLSLFSEISIDGDWTLQNGTIDAGSSIVHFLSQVDYFIRGSFIFNQITVRAWWNSINITDDLTIDSDFEVNSDNGALGLELLSTLTINGNLTFTGTYQISINIGELHVKGDMLIDYNRFNYGSGTMYIDGTANQTLTGSGVNNEGCLPFVIIDKPSGTLLLASTITVTEDWNYIRGTVDPGSSTVVFNNFVESHTLNPVGTSETMRFNNLVIDDYFWTRTLFLTGDLLLDGDLIIESDASFNAGSSNIRIAGDFSQNNSNDYFTETSGLVTFDGSGTQNINSVPGEHFNHLVIDKTSGDLNLNDDVTINTGGSMTFINGIINSSASGLLHIEDNATASGASNSSFVKGPMTKIGDDDFEFPVGDVIWQPLAISSMIGGSAATEFQVTYLQAVPPNDNDLDLGVDHISSLEYWEIDHNDGATVDVTFHWKDADLSEILDISVAPQDLFIAHYNATAMQWENIGGTINGGSAVGPGAAGSITITAQSTFSPFTFMSAGNANPLPVELTTFEAHSTNDGTMLVWETASEINNDFFEVQKSTDGLNFATLQTVTGAGTTSTPSRYEFLDEASSNRQTLTYYRLKQVDYDGTFAFSRILTVTNHSLIQDPIIVPNPFQNRLSITIYNPDGESNQVSLLDFSGRTLYQTKLSGNAEETILLQEELTNIPNGVYILQIASPEGHRHFKIQKLK